MAIRLRQSTQKEQQASAASFGLGLDHGDGGTRAIQGALDQVAGAANQIAGNLERKDAAAQKSNADRKRGLAGEQFKADVQAGDILLAEKQWDKLAEHESMMKKKWVDDFDLNDLAYSTAGDSSVREEFTTQAASDFRESYSDAMHRYNINGIAGRTAHEAEVTFKKSADVLSIDSANDDVTWFTGEAVSQELGNYFSSPVFAESSPAAQEIYVKHGVDQMGAYVDAMRFSQSRNPDIGDAEKQLSTAMEQVRQAEWMGVDAQNSMLKTLGIQLKSVNDGESIHLTLNDFNRGLTEAASTGFAGRDINTVTGQYLSAKERVAKDSAQERSLESSYSAYLLQIDMNGADQRQWMVDNPTGSIKDIPGMDTERLKHIDDTDMNKVLSSRNAIVKAYRDADSKYGRFAAKKTLYPYASEVFASFDDTVATMSAKLDAGEALTPTDRARLQREAGTLKRIIGEDDPSLGPTETVSGDVMVVGVEASLELLKSSPHRLGSVVEILTAANDGNFNVDTFFATTSDTDSEDMKVLKAGGQTSLYVAPNDIMYEAVSSSLSFQRSDLGGDALKEYDAVHSYMKEKNDGRSLITGGLQAHARKYGSEDEAMFFANLENATIAMSVKNNPGWLPEAHVDNARKLIGSVAQTYEGSDGRSLLLYANTRGKLDDRGIMVHGGRLSATLAALVDTPLFAGASSSEAILAADSNATREEITDMAYHWAGEYVKDNYDNIIEQWAAGLTGASDAERAQAQEDIRNNYPVDLLLQDFNLSTEMISPTTGKRVIGLTMLQKGPGGFIKGQEIVKMDNARGASGQMPNRGVFIPVDEIIDKLQDPEMAVKYREHRRAIDKSNFKYQVMNPIKQGLAKAMDFVKSDANYKSPSFYTGH